MTDLQKQCLLTFLGYDTGGVGNGWGPKSRNATECCQKELGIPADGVWGELTETAVLEAVYTYDVDAPELETIPESTGNPELDKLFEGIRYWQPEEFRCRCGEYHAPYCDGFPVLPDRTLLELVDDLRDRAGAPAIRSSAIRCYQHNIDSNGVWNSKHKEGKALDFFIQGMSGERLLALALDDPRTSYAYIITPGEPYVHVDVK